MKDKRYWELELTDENYKDLQTWIKNEKVIGLVDEKMGGIIGYIHKVHSDEIIKNLNKVDEKENYKKAYNILMGFWDNLGDDEKLIVNTALRKLGL